MPLELGIDLGCRAYGKDQLREKTLLILDRQQYRYEQFISDIKGQDIHVHGNNARRIIYVVRDWLSTESKRTNIPGGARIYEKYLAFRRALPRRCAASELEVNDLTFNEFAALVYEWVSDNRR